MAASPTPDTTPNPAALTRGRLLARNAGWNLVMQCAPMAVALVTIPVLIAGIGAERFGLLTLAWIALGYFSLFDMGLGRALTKLVADELGRGAEHNIPSLVWTASALMGALGLLGALFVGLITPWLVRDTLGIVGPLRGEAVRSFLLIGALLPVVISSSGLRGVMEAHQEFRSINLVKMGTGLFALVGPLLVLPLTRSLFAVVGTMAAGKVAAWLLYASLCLRTVPGLRRGSAPRLALVRPLVRFGGWMTVANVINPIMVQMDRFLIGALLSTAAVAYYTTPYELVTKYWFLSNAVLGVMFPAFATSFVADRDRTGLIFGRGVKYVFLILFPLVLGTIALAPELLTAWLGVQFAREGTFVLRCLALGVLLNGLAQVPSALLQGVGRPDLTALLHVLELPVYLVTAWTLIRARGIEGAALAWTARTALDLVLFFGAVHWVLPSSTGIVRALARALVLAVPIVIGCALPASPIVRGSLMLLVGAATAGVTWGRLLTPEEKAPMLDLAAATWGRMAPISSRAVAEPPTEVKLTASSPG